MRAFIVWVACSLGSAGSMLAQQDDTIYKPGNGVSLPKLVTDVRPNYTPEAMRRRISGAVLLQCVVDREGVPTNIEIVQPLDESLDEAAVKALQQWRFEPGKKDGQAVLVQIDVKMAFTTAAKRKRWWWPRA